MQFIKVRFLLSLVIVLLAYFSVIIPCSVVLSDDSVIAYTLVLNNRNPIIESGDTVVITGFLSGHGIPERNKISITWSSPDVLDKSNPGTFEIAGFSPVGIDLMGITSRFPPPMFRDDENTPLVEWGYPSVLSERSFAYGETITAPIILKLNTSKDAPDGDYLVSFVFTYGNEQTILQDYKDVSFHIMSGLERNEQSFQISAVIIAVIALVVSTIYSVLGYHKQQNKKNR